MRNSHSVVVGACKYRPSVTAARRMGTEHTRCVGLVWVFAQSCLDVCSLVALCGTVSQLAANTRVWVHVCVCGGEVGVGEGVRACVGGVGGGGLCGCTSV